MRQSFNLADFEALAELWNTFYPEKYAVDAELIRLNTIDSPVFDWGVSQIEVEDGKVVGFVSFKRSAAGLYKGPSVDHAHLSAIAYADPRVGVDLVADAKRILRNRGISRVHFGADSRHFWPGCPMDVGSLCGFLMVEGFEESGESHDLERDLSDYSPPRPIDSNYRYRPISTEEELVSLRVFMEAEFPNRWRYDLFEKVNVEESPNFVFAAFDGSDVVGFALLQDASHKVPIGGGVWRHSLGESWGSLGPVGVANELRGHGLGHSLMGSALSHLRDRGVRRCIIDWTTLDEFYGVHGFEVTRKYRPSSLRLSD